MKDAEQTERAARGAVIKDKREKLGLSQQKLAIRIGVTRASVSYWESGTYEVDLTNALKLVRELDLNLSDVLSKRQYEHVSATDLLDTERAVIHSKRLVSGPLDGHVLSEDALNVAMLWDQLPGDDPHKYSTRVAIEEAHQAAFPDYWTWSRSVRKKADAVHEKKVKRKYARKPT